MVLCGPTNPNPNPYPKSNPNPKRSLSIALFGARVVPFPNSIRIVLKYRAEVRWKEEPA